MNNITIGLAQTIQTADLSRNRETIFRFMDQASEAGVDILCFPESQTVGYRVDITAADFPCPERELDALHKEVARRCANNNMSCILGTETPIVDRKPYNSALVIDNEGSILGRHHKTRLTPLDALAYSPGDDMSTYMLSGIQVGVVICYEGFRYAETTASCVEQGAQLIFHPQNNTTRPNDWKIPIHHALIVSRAAENTVWFASCNACFSVHQNSRSMIVCPDGTIDSQLELGQEALLVSEIDIDKATRAMFRYDMSDTAEILFRDTVKSHELKPARND
ncbi:MAG: carbon-nitrogen hydrolase family protein [Planctomycetota bacterium]|nr:carbon-nitrogen hydrolase family protein [Planctomycetota bacterium]